MGETVGGDFFAVLTSDDVPLDIAREQEINKAENKVISKAPLVGSVAAGTAIQLADGSTKTIELINIGDQITLCNLSEVNACDSQGTVVFNVSGRSSTIALPLVKTQSGKEVLTTRQHPFQLSNGNVVSASQLKPGDSLRGADGSTEIVSFVNIGFQSNLRVYSLSFSLTQATADTQLGYVANSIVVGDYSTQLYLSSSQRQSLGNAPEIGSTEYEEDRRNHLSLN